jgi:hypothetical protein
VADAQHDDDFQEGDGGGFRHHVGRTADAEEATSAASECSVLFGIFVVKQSISVGVVLQAKFSTGERSMVGNPVEDERDSGLKPNTIPL